MITDAMIRAAWRALPRHLQDRVDGDEVRRMLAAALAERRWDEVRVIAQVPQRPDAEGDW